MDLFPMNLVERILEFVSFELLVTFFPKNTRIYDRHRHNFRWWYSLEVIYQTNVLNWFIATCNFPTDTLVSSFRDDDVIHFLDVVGSNRIYANHFKFIVHDYIYDTSGYSHKLVDFFCASGNLDMLLWWFRTCTERNLPFLYTAASVDNASTKGHINILEWWKFANTVYKLPFRYTRNAIDRTYDVRVLNWWKYAPFPLVYSTRNIDHCMKKPVLDWWFDLYLNYEFRLKYKNWSIINACSNNRIDILDWWFSKRHLIKMKYDERAVDYASERGHRDVLEWWFDKFLQYQLPMKYTCHAVDLASANGHINVLEWWLDKHKSNALRMKRSGDAINLAMYYGKIQVLEFWISASRNFKLGLMYNKYYVDKYLNTNQQVMNWWKNKTKKEKNDLFRYFE